MGSSADPTVAGSPRLPSLFERSYGEQLRCRRGCFLFGGATIRTYRGTFRRAYVWSKYGIDMVRRRRTACDRMELHDEEDGKRSVGVCGAVSAVMRADVRPTSCCTRTGTHIRAVTSTRTCCRRRRRARTSGLTTFFDFFRAVYRSVRSVQNTN